RAYVLPRKRKAREAPSQSVAAVSTTSPVQYRMKGCVCTNGKSSVSTSTPDPRPTATPVRWSTTSAATKGSEWYQPHLGHFPAPPKTSDRENLSLTGIPQHAEMRRRAPVLR